MFARKSARDCPFVFHRVAPASFRASRNERLMWTAPVLCFLRGRGMQRVAVDPDFEENRRIYVCGTSDLSAPHSKCRMRFGPADGYSYLTTGDRHSSAMLQTRTIMGSKVRCADEDTPFEGFEKRPSPLASGMCRASPLSPTATRR